jgi:RimJ/RimL family protein N-acetyltransferase
MDLKDKRRAVRPLLDQIKPADALETYYTFYHSDERTSLVVYPPGAQEAEGYIALSRTGMDLFRPLVTMRLPLNDHQASSELVQSALPEGAPSIIYAPDNHAPLLSAFIDIQVEERVRVLVLDHVRFEPVINVLVTQEQSPNGLPRFVIRSRQDDDRVAASASINWQTPTFAEISVFTEADHRRQGWGHSVVAALCQHILEDGRTPLYTVGENNRPSLQLAESSGFIDQGIRRMLSQGARRPMES